MISVDMRAETVFRGVCPFANGTHVLKGIDMFIQKVPPNISLEQSATNETDCAIIASHSVVFHQLIYKALFRLVSVACKKGKQSCTVS